jgi:hypothetical protein
VSDTPSSAERWEVEPAIADPRRRYVTENGPGIAVSSLLHGLALLLIFFVFKAAVQPTHEQLKTVLVEIIHLGAETSAPPAPQKSPVPQSQAFARRKPPHARLRALATLTPKKTPQTTHKPETQPTACAITCARR